MLDRLRRGGEAGFSMLVTMGVLTVCSALIVAAASAVVGDMPIRKESRDKKVAFAAAEAGLNFYMSRLNLDNEYWVKCTAVAAPNPQEPSPVNQRWDGAGTDPRAFRRVPGEEARYTIELLPAVGATCTPSTAATTMVDPATGALRIRATGASGSQRRSIIATLRRKSFLDYIYFTDFEVLDPTVVNSSATYAAGCRRYRASRPKTPQSAVCTDIQFAGNDKVNGPFHTNDDLLACPGATFGRGPADRIEVSGPAPGYKNGTNCGTGSPVFKSTFQAGVPALAVPTSNAKVASIAVAPWVLTGTHRLVLEGTNARVYVGSSSSYTTQALPANGVIYVKNGSGCGAGVSPGAQTYTEPTGCANVSVSGTYGQGLTIVSDKDIVLDGNLKRTGDHLLGLIATNFVRVRHRVNRGTSPCSNVAPLLPDPLEIEAAILTLEHSFIVDNWNCGAPLGTLKVTGAIAQRFRGPVGTSGNGTTTGYVKDYTYDDRLKFRNPPHFLDPVAAAWRILRRNEQVPAR